MIYALPAKKVLYMLKAFEKVLLWWQNIYQNPVYCVMTV